MPPTFLYMLALAAWLSLAALVWLLAALLTILPRTRPLGFSLTLAMATTFPAVLIFQLVSAPLAICIVLLAALIVHMLDPGHPLVIQDHAAIVVSVAAVLITLLLMAGASCWGFYEGWRVGWLRAQGHGWREALRQGPSAKAWRLFKRWRRDQLSVAGQ